MEALHLPKGVHGKVIFAHRDGFVEHTVPVLSNNNRQEAADANSNAGVTISVDEGIRYQTISAGFGASLTDSSAYLITTMPNMIRDYVLGQLFHKHEGMGLNILRVPISASDFSLSNYTYDELASGETDAFLTKFDIVETRKYIFPVLKQIMEINPDVNILLEAWSPPSWMKNTESLLGRVSGTDSKLLCQFYQSYASYWAKVILAFRAEGINVQMMTIQNSPTTASDTSPGMIMTEEEQTLFINTFLAPAFEFYNVKDIRVYAYGGDWNNIDYPEYVFKNLNTAAKSYVTAAAFHCDRDNVTHLTEFHNRVPSARILQSQCGRTVATSMGWTLDFAHDMENMFLGALNNWAEGSMKWNIILDQNYGPTNHGCLDCIPVITYHTESLQVGLNEDFFALGLVSKNFKAGSVRVDAKSSDPTAIATAVINPDDTHAVIVLNNDRNSKDVTVVWSGKTMSKAIPALEAAAFIW